MAQTDDKSSPGPQVAEFEQSLDELEQLVAKMEQGDQSLDESLKSFERGIVLFRNCQSALEQAELRVRLLSDPQSPDDAEDFQPACLERAALTSTQRDPPAALTDFSARTDTVLSRVLPPENQAPEALHRAMRYAVLGGGKRLRPVLVYATGSALGASLDRLDASAAAVEIIHAYSLVHDDLPAMDDDALRRGRPTCHVAFGEAMAILAGDALQALAFEVLAGDRVAEPSIHVEMLRTLGDGLRIARHGRRSGARSRRDRQATDAAGTRTHARPQDRRADPRIGAARRARRRLPRCARCSTRWSATATRSAWPSRSATTSSTSKATAPSSARPRARTRPTTSRPTPPSSAWMKRVHSCGISPRKRSPRCKPLGDRAMSLIDIARYVAERES